MAGITNLAKGAAKNIAQALSTDGVGKALAKRAAIYGGFGAVGGGTLSAIQGGSFGEGAVRGGILGAGVGAATGAYKMGAFGNSVLDEAGRFRKGASTVYAQVASDTAKWEQVNMYRQKDFNAFMNHMKNAQDADDLAARFRQMDGTSKKKYKFKRKQTEPAITGHTTGYGSQTATNASGFVDITPNGSYKQNFVDITPKGYTTNYPSSNVQLIGLPAGTSKITSAYSQIGGYLPSGTAGYLPEGSIQKAYNGFANSVKAGKNGINTWNRIEGEGRKIAKGLYNIDNLSTEQISEGISRYLDSPVGQKLMDRRQRVKRGYNTFLNALTS